MPVLAAEAWQSLRSSLLELNRLGEAEAASREELKIYESVYGRDAAERAEALSGLALVLSKAGNEKAAEPLYREALSILDKTRGRTHPSYAAATLGLAATLSTLGRGPESEPLYKQVLALNRKLYGKAHIQIATTLNDLAAMYGTNRRVPEAVATHREALAEYRAALGAEHPFVAKSLSNLATNLTLLGELDEAERVGKEALRMTTKLLGPDHPSVSTNLQLLAVIAFRREDFVTAERIFRDGLSRRLNRTPPNLLLVANSRVNVAGALAARGMWSEAGPLYEAAIAYYRGNLSANSARIATSLTALGECRYLEGKPELAEQSGREAVEAAEKIQGDVGRASLAGALASLGRTRLAMGAHREAAELLRQSRELRDSNAAHRDMYFGLNVSALGRAMAVDGKHIEARKFLEEGASILRTNKHTFAKVEMERNGKALALARP